MFLLVGYCEVSMAAEDPNSQDQPKPLTTIEQKMLQKITFEFSRCAD